MYSRRRSNKPSDSLVSKFREDFDSLMQSHQSTSLPPASCAAEASAPANAAHHAQASTPLLDLSHLADVQHQHFEKTGITPDFSNSDHLPSEWRNAFLGQTGSNFDMPDFQGALFPGTPTPGLDGSTQRHVSSIAPGLGLETPVSASASTAHFFPSRSQSLSLSDPVFTQGPSSLHHAATFPQMGGGFPPHLFENQRLNGVVSQNYGGAYGSPTQGQMGLAGFGMNESVQHMPSSWEYHLQANPGNQYAISEQDDAEDEGFRFSTTLKAATAMVKQQDEHPVTYLNKSQLYELLIRDRQPHFNRSFGQQTYRTAVRISFEDEQMRRRPEAAWKLWWDGRGKDEAYKRAGKRQAVEFSTPDSGHDAGHNANVRLIHETFDGFSVEWMPIPGRPVGCSLYMRFNFLSTDFSLSKGVKGCSVRLCSKTELLHADINSAAPMREISYCHVKTFRDHGAERKLQNDKQHVAKQMERVKKQIEQAEADDLDTSKRKRRASYAGGRPSKMARARRASGSSHSSNEEDELGSDDLRKRLRSYEQMPRSTKSESRLYLRGEEQDDLDRHPIILHGASPQPRGQDMFQTPSLRPEPSNFTSSSAGTPSMSRPASNPLKAGNANHISLYPTPPHITSQSSAETLSMNTRPRSNSESIADMQQLASPVMSSSMRIGRRAPPLAAGAVPSIEVKDLDPSYKSPPSPNNKPACCLFVKPSIAGHRIEDDNYRAIYLRHRNLEEFVMAVTAKCGLDHTCVVSTVRVGGRGVPIRVEDDMIQAIPEQQDMLAEFDPVDLTHDTAEDLFKTEDDGAKTPPIKYQLTLRY